MRASVTNETRLVVAAQAGDRRALDELVTAYLPLVYTVVRRALNDHPDVDDVVQEIMLRVLRKLSSLRDLDRFRPWLLAIAMRQVGTQLRRGHLAAKRNVALDEVFEAPEADLEGVTLLCLELSDQRRQVVHASRWLDPDYRLLLSLYWLETAGQVTRAELATAMKTSVAHAGVRVQRMRNQLELSRSLVAALGAKPRCPGLASVVTDWSGVPSPLWRKRIARHTRSCPRCTRAAGRLIPPERLLVGFALLPVPMALAAALTGKSLSVLTGTAGGAGAASGAGAVGVGLKAGLIGQLAQAIGAHPVAAAVAASGLVAGVAVTAVNLPAPPPAPVVVAAPTPTRHPTPPAMSAPKVASPALVRPRPTAGKPSGTGAQRLASGMISLEAANETGLMVAIADSLGVLERTTADSDKPARWRATFEVVRGLADANCVSLRAKDGQYLRHSSWRLRLLSNDKGTELFREDATFCVRTGFTPGSVTLESFNYPGWFIRHRGNELWVDQADGTAAFRADASFLPRSPLAG